MKIILILVLFLINFQLCESQTLMIPIKVSDGFTSDTLFFGLDTAATDGIDGFLGENELPPLPPSGVFDARFVGTGLTPPVPIGNGLKKDFRGTNFIQSVVKIHRLSYLMGSGSNSVILSWWNLPIIASFRIQDIITGTLIDTTISSNGSFLVPNPLGFSSLKLSVTYIFTPSPVELNSFTCDVNDNNLKLNWSTSEEINNSGFDIERLKIDESGWTKVGFIAGSLNSTENRYYSYTDRNLSIGEFKYRLKQIDFNGNFEYFYLSENVRIGIPEYISLYQNYPNPFNPNTTIKYNLSKDSQVRISVFDNSGHLVNILTDGFRKAGYYELVFDGANLSSGIYYYKLSSGEFYGIKKMLLLK